MKKSKFSLHKFIPSLSSIQISIEYNDNIIMFLGKTGTGILFIKTLTLKHFGTWEGDKMF